MFHRQTVSQTNSDLPLPPRRGGHVPCHLTLVPQLLAAELGEGRFVIWSSAYAWQHFSHFISTKQVLLSGICQKGIKTTLVAKRCNSSWRLSEQLKVFKAGQTRLGSTVLLGLVKPDHQFLLRQKVSHNLIELIIMPTIY